MKTEFERSICTSSSANASGRPFVSWVKDEAKPAHGGIVTVAKDVSYELVARPDLISLYVSDHGNPVDLAGATAKVTLLSAGKKEETTLVPAADSLQAKGAFAVGAGTKVVANVSLKGQAPQPIRFSLK